MKTKTPTIRQTAWISLIPHFGIMGLIMFVWWQFNPEKAVLYGAMNYLVLSFSLRRIIARDHRKGMQQVRLQKFADALQLFEKSYHFFEKYAWVDKYRYLTLLSSSSLSYREMALNNIAFCYGQLGDGKKAIEYYERALTEFPESGIAMTALNMLNSVNNKET